jgi:CRP/FNR family transcriptional regulator, cyclic AMP receptor protein
MPLFRTLKIDEADLALGAQLLLNHSAIAPVMALDEREARLIVSYMSVVTYAAGAVVVQQGQVQDALDERFMLLLLDGNVSVEQTVVSRTQPFVMTILSTGSMIGEMSIIDGSTRSATCTANTDVRAAKLSYYAFMALLENKPKVGVKLLLALAQRLSMNLRDSSHKIFLYAQLVQAMDEDMASKLPAEAAFGRV